VHITIIDNEVYLAQSISAKLVDYGHECSVVATLNEVDGKTEVILISTNISGNLNAFLQQHADKIIILMVTYVSDDTVTKPMAAGATDYIIKPFMIEELVRKIDHYKDVKYLKHLNRFFIDYLDDKFKKCNIQVDKNIKFPLVLVGSQKQTDAFIYEYMKKTKKVVKFLSLENENALQIIKENKETIIYATSIQKLKKSDADAVIKLASERNIVISTSSELDCNLPTIHLGSSQDGFDSDEILTLDDYVKYILITYQDRFPDTELSKKLGISRKSLWERRKKYDIYKQK